jgi:hypothetical protein
MFDSVRIVVGPVDKTAEIIPFKHPTHVYPIPYAERNPFCDINVMRNQ